MSARVHPLRDATGVVVAHLGALEDVTTRRRVQSKFSALSTAARLLLESPRLDAVLPATTTLAQGLVAADGYAVWRANHEGEWRIVASTGVSDRFVEAFVRRDPVAPVLSVPFSAALAVDDVTKGAPSVERRAAYLEEGIRAVLVAPLRIGGTLSGSLAFYYRTVQRFDDIRIQTAEAFANVVAVAISTAELYDAQLGQKQQLERAGQQAAFLAEAGVALNSSLDYEETLRAVARLAVPGIADWCAVDILQEDGRLKRLAVTHADPEKVAMAESLRERFGDDVESLSAQYHVLRTGAPLLVPRITEEMLFAATQDAAQRQTVRDVGLVSYLAVPLVAHGRSLGVLTLVTAEFGRVFGEDDLRFAVAVAGRAALAVANASAYQAVHAANRAKDEFLATLSHELRTPINAVMGWAQMLQQGVVDPLRTAKAVDAIVRNATMQSRLIEDLLDLSRIVSGTLRLDVELVDLSVVVSAAIATIEPAAHAKGLRLQVVADQGEARVYGDHRRLQQAVWNLLANAVKFTPKGGSVQVHVLRINSHVEILVSDTGEGIDPDVLPHVFDRFRQGDNSPTRQHAGLGLGLAIVRYLAEAHGGTVEASSDGPGMGATFRLTFPLSIAKIAARSDPASVAHPAARPITAETLALDALPDLTGTGVLIVEDDSEAREMLAYLLRQQHADVTVAASVEEALDAMGIQVPDVMISDIEMPGRDGYDLIAAIRARAPEAGGRVPAAALTAYSRPADRARSLVAGYDAHLSKPVDLAELIATVARLTTRSALRSRDTPSAT